ncbi:hypothetical protein H206_06336 [Candidatus Electrothrix aarhusensis]|uniref:Uncharacterized protein n=1 Tax=Candidatus Electrothrix aarhusensis TaxID=1859131 RepID=A0A3S3R9L4_9BACT|nr:hypothetical protein H206_06336 [Candidatus Electrothrix aarhusensis]
MRPNRSRAVLVVEARLGSTNCWSHKEESLCAKKI